MKIFFKAIFALFLLLALAIVSLNVWGRLTLGTLAIDTDAQRDNDANRVVLISGATGSVGDGLLKAAIQDPEVVQIHVISRRSSPRIDAGVESGKVELHLLEDFTDYSSLSAVLPDVNTVLWGLGTSSLNVDDETFTWIHVDFPVAFVKAWLDTRTEGPMSFHYITGMGTDPDGSRHWEREKGRAELEVAEMAAATDMRSFAYRSAMVRRTSERATSAEYVMETLLKPGFMVITAVDLGGAMLEIAARTDELPNGTIIDNADSIVYAQAYKEHAAQR
ncbi:MAG: hypothetical protein ABJK20_05590 [Halieaceae bacterium]